MMNRQIYRSLPALCLAALLGAASCTQEDEPSGGRTAFDGGIVFTSPYTLTRSDAMRYGSFREGDQVGVLGYSEAFNGDLNVSSSDWNTKKEFCKPEVFYNQPLEYTADGLWTYNWTGTGNVGGLHPWYSDDTYTYAFFAYYPYVEVNGWNSSGTIPFNGSTRDGGMGTITLSGENETNDPVITYTMPHEGTSTARDILDWQRVPDFMLANNVTHTKAKGAVNLGFRHLFCAFEFKVNNYNTEPVTVSNLYVSGKDFYKSVTVTGQENGYHIGDDRYTGRFNVTSAYGNDGSFECPAGEEITDGDGNIVEVRPATVTLTTDGTATPDGDPIDLLFIPNEHGKLTADDNASLTLHVE